MSFSYLDDRGLFIIAMATVGFIGFVLGIALGILMTIGVVTWLL